MVFTKAWLLLVKHDHNRGEQLSIEPISVAEWLAGVLQNFVYSHSNLSNAIYVASPSGEDGQLVMYKFVDNKFLDLCNQVLYELYQRSSGRDVKFSKERWEKDRDDNVP